MHTCLRTRGRTQTHIHAYARAHTHTHTYVADGSDVDGRLARDDLRRERRELGNIKGLQVLVGEVRLHCADDAIR